MGAARRLHRVREAHARQALHAERHEGHAAPAAARRRFLRLPLRVRRQGRGVHDRLRAQARGPRRGREIRGVLPRRRRGDLRRDVRARRGDQREGRLGPLEQHRRRRALPDGAREAPGALPPRARQQRCDAGRPAEGGAPLRGAHSRRPGAQGLRRVRRPGDRSLSTLRGLRVLALVLLAALSLFLLFAPAANALRNVVFDGYQQLFPLERTTDPVAIVVIDEEAIAHYGQWPWPRTRIAELITRISEAQPASIGLDLFFSEPDRFSPAAMADEMPILPTNLAKALREMPSNDEQLAKAIEGRNVVLGIGTTSDVDPRFRGPPRAAPVVTSGARETEMPNWPGYIGSLDVIDAAAAGHGLMNSGPQDQVVRVVPIVERIQGVIVPTLGVESVRVAE